MHAPRARAPCPQHTGQQLVWRLAASAECMWPVCRCLWSGSVVYYYVYYENNCAVLWPVLIPAHSASIISDGILSRFMRQTGMDASRVPLLRPNTIYNVCVCVCARERAVYCARSPMDDCRSLESLRTVSHMHCENNSNSGNSSSGHIIHLWNVSDCYFLWPSFPIKPMPTFMAFIDYPIKMLIAIT